jgi:hypothetical protein
LALIALAAGALLGLRVAWPELVEEALDPDELTQAVENDADWGHDFDWHLRRASRARIRVAKNARQLNKLKAEKLQNGIRFAGAGVVLLLGAVVWVTIDAVIP